MNSALNTALEVDGLDPEVDGLDPEVVGGLGPEVDCPDPEVAGGLDLEVTGPDLEVAGPDPGLIGGLNQVSRIRTNGSMSFSPQYHSSSSHCHSQLIITRANHKKQVK